MLDLSHLAKKNTTQLELRSSVLQAVRILESGLSNPPSAAKMAALVGLSRSHFHLAFRTIVGESYKNHVMRLRLEAAASFLLSSEMSCSEVAVTCGFSTPSSFTRAFGKLFGLSPNLFRRRALLVSDQGRYQAKGGEATSVRVERWPGQRLICLRTYSTLSDITKAWTELVNWLESRPPQVGVRYFGLWFDDWNCTEPTYRYESAVLVPEFTSSDIPNHFHLRELPAGLMAIHHAQGSVVALEAAWRRFYEKWLPASPFRLRTSFGLEEYPEQFISKTDFRKLVVATLGGLSLDLCLPVLDGESDKTEATRSMFPS